MIKKPNILFVNLPSIPFDDIIASFNNQNELCQSLSMPMGILYLSSYLKKFNHDEIGEVGILDYVLELKNLKNYSSIDEFIINAAKKIDFKPDIVAFSLIFSTSQLIFDNCVEKIKKIWKDSISVVGGNHATSYKRNLLRNPDVDYIVLGEGELALSQFVKNYSNLDNFKLKGIYSKNDLNNDVVFENADYIKDLDTLPFPDWDLLDTSEYFSSETDKQFIRRKRRIGEAKSKKLGTIITSRGCPFKCTFCASHIIHGRKMRFRSPENVALELKNLYEKYGVNLISPEDDVFTMTEDRCLKMLKLIRDLNIPDFEMQLPSGLSVKTLNEKVIDELAKTGVNIFTLAIESGSEYVQKNVINKNCDLDKAKELVRYIRSKGFMVRCYFILGFFGETKEQMYETINYVKELGADWAAFMIATPLIGSEMYNQLIKAGYIKENIELFSKIQYAKRSFDTPEISADELNDLAYRANLECNFINNVNKINKNYEKAIDIYNDIVLSYPFHIIALYCIMECYEGLGNYEKAEELKEKIINLIKTDSRSKKMFDKYHDLTPKLAKI